MGNYPLTNADRALIDGWSHTGLPTNDSTQEYAVALLVRLLKAYDHLADELDQGWAS